MITASVQPRSRRWFFTSGRLEPGFLHYRDLGKHFPDTLAAAGLAVERHHDFFPPDGSDEQWLEYVGKNGRIALTHNERIRYPK